MLNFIIDTLYEHGFEAYAVGGSRCVTESPWRVTPQDWDVTTSAKPARSQKRYLTITMNCRYPAWHGHGHAGACEL